MRLGIHLSSEDVKNPCHFECPHRLSDKLLKSSCDALYRSVARSRIIRFPHSESSAYFAFLCRLSPSISVAESSWPGGLFAVVPCQWRRIIGGNSEAVSYTHLDVYKRQHPHHGSETLSGSAKYRRLSGESAKTDPPPAADPH